MCHVRWPVSKGSLISSTSMSLNEQRPSDLEFALWPNQWIIRYTVELMSLSFPSRNLRRRNAMALVLLSSYDLVAKQAFWFILFRRLHISDGFVGVFDRFFGVLENFYFSSWLSNFSAPRRTKQSHLCHAASFTYKRRTHVPPCVI